MEIRKWVCVPLFLFASITVDARKVIEKVVIAHGGKEAFYHLRDVQYELITRDLVSQKEERSLERYLFEGEQSAGEKSDSLTRKTNYYRFAIPFKFLDRGVQITYLGEKQGRIMVEITFDPSVSESRNRFRLYIDPKTQRIDQYLFTLDPRQDPTIYLVENSYQEISGIQVAIERRYWKSNWEGQKNGQMIRVEQLRNVRFWNGFTAEDFKKSLQ